jgi:hypothetical protein
VPSGIPANPASDQSKSERGQPGSPRLSNCRNGFADRPATAARVRHPAQVHGNIVRGLKAVRGILGEACTHHAVEHRRRERLAGRDGLRIFFQNRGEYAELRFAFESAASSDHFVEHASEAEQIAASVSFRALQKFRRHVLKGSDDRTLLRERRHGRSERSQIHGRRGRSERPNAPRGNRTCQSGFAKPKSISFAPALVSMMFAGFRSRWIMPCDAPSPAPARFPFQSSELDPEAAALRQPLGQSLAFEIFHHQEVGAVLRPMS